MRRLELVYKKLCELSKGQGVSTEMVAKALGLSRANVSSDLNKLHKDGRVRKSDGRPTLYTPQADSPAAGEGETTLGKLVKANKSLVTAGEQAKAAILYPPRGMHTLILGETGVGKSMFAGIMHRYAIEMKKMRKDAPFITFNCADYANNPQLLLSHLFGVKKGAYTGADTDRKGLIEKADGGILFLDEVHRLPAEGQEMFFTFMDKGRFRRLGESDEERAANVLIISATTENPDSTLLKTFTRRIPMIIKLPQLRERGMEERFNLILNFFKEEAFHLDREIHVSTNAMRAFLSYHCPNNVGQLKTDIQLACARAYADFVSYRKDCIQISSSDLANHVREGLHRIREHRDIWNRLIGINNRYYSFRPNQEAFDLLQTKDADSIYDLIDAKVEDLKKQGVSSQELDRIMDRDIEDYFSQYLHGVGKRFDKSSLSNVIDPAIINLVEEMVKYCEPRLNKTLSQQVCLGMAMHINALIERRKRNEKIINPQLSRLRCDYKKEFNLALDCLSMIEKALDVSLPIDEAGYLTMFFVLDEKEEKDSDAYVKILVVAHGTATATSMAEVTNQLLGVDYAAGMNAPLDISPKEILNRVKAHIVENSTGQGGVNRQGYLLLVDMGSLTTFGEVIEKETGIPVRCIPMVSTAHVLEATRKAMLGCSLEDLYNDVAGITLANEKEPESRITAEKSPKMTIVTVCMTGEGSAVTIKSFLEHNLRFDDKLLEIVPINLVDPEDITSRIKKLSQKANIIAVISPFKIDTNIPQYNLDDVLNLRAIHQVQEAIHIQETYLTMGKTLKHQLRNIDGETVFESIRASIAAIEAGLGIKMRGDNLIGIALHISCMVDRLKENEALVQYPDKDMFMAGHQNSYRIVRQAVKLLENSYNIQIPDDEICFIMNFFVAENEMK